MQKCFHSEGLGCLQLLLVWGHHHLLHEQHPMVRYSTGPTATSFPDLSLFKITISCLLILSFSDFNPSICFLVKFTLWSPFELQNSIRYLLNHSLYLVFLVISSASITGFVALGSPILLFWGQYVTLYFLKSTHLPTGSYGVSDLASSCSITSCSSAVGCRIPWAALSVGYLGGSLRTSSS